MTALEPSVSRGDPAFRSADAALRKLTEETAALAAKIREGGGAAAHKRHAARGKLPARERISLLLDPGSPFLEIGMFAAHEVYDHPLPAAGLIAGIGWVVRRPVMILANDATVKGGAYYPLTVKKHLRAQEIAQNCRLPCIYMVDSGGAFLSGQDEVFPDRDHFGRIFYNQAQMSAAGIAQLAAVMGPCTAGGAYIPAMADESVIVKGTGAIYLAGAPLLRAATGEISDSETLGGARTHARISGLADYEAEDDAGAIAILRRMVASLKPPDGGAMPADSPLPRHDPQDLYGIAGGGMRRPYDMREVIARLADGSEFDEFKPQYGETLVTGFARLGGMRIGIVANNGALFCESAQKGAHFIQLAGSRGASLLFLQNTPGFMVGAKHEAAGIAKYGALMVHAVSRAPVAKITLITGGSYGAGNYAMCGRAFSPDFLFSWPGARIAVMGGEQAAGVMDMISRAPPAARKRERVRILEQFERQSSALYASARLWDDGIIAPDQTRDTLRVAFAAVAARPPGSGHPGVLRM